MKLCRAQWKIFETPRHRNTTSEEQLPSPRPPSHRHTVTPNAEILLRAAAVEAPIQPQLNASALVQASANHQINRE
ncbi:uncharacterized protein Dmoj_GI27038 [Drosophila mojavensis]|uniref:Uncharacterized protein n=1 Tax=Drosophila mojavensis TaxID=7230 RepID=A0A0Q9XPD5_DROMO|nr:uncharacterized protein Dmoj_GI27038 [Drosophila mojavensis]